MPTSPNYEVCGLVVLTKPEHQCRVEQQLRSMEGVDIHAQDHCGKFAITVEETDESQPMLQKISLLQNSPEIVDVAFVYGQRD